MLLFLQPLIPETALRPEARGLRPSEFDPQRGQESEGYAGAAARAVSRSPPRLPCSKSRCTALKKPSSRA